MSGQKFARSLITAAAALIMSSVAVGAAVGPAQVAINPIVSQTYA
jgi:hypothetical protein